MKIHDKADQLMSKQLHVALMVPINNSTMEQELSAWLPPGTRCTTLRIPRGQGLLTQDTIPAYMDQAIKLAASLVGSDIDLLAYGCTAASFLSGPAADAQLAHQLSALIGKPVVTTAQSMVLALQNTQARKIALVTPYQDVVNQQLKAFLAASGIEVLAFDSLRAANVEELGQIKSGAVAKLARSTFKPACEALFIACSQLPTYDIVAELSAEFERPVLSSIQATAWQIQRRLGLF